MYLYILITKPNDSEPYFYSQLHVHCIKVINQCLELGFLEHQTFAPNWNIPWSPYKIVIWGKKMKYTIDLFNKHYSCMYRSNRSVKIPPPPEQPPEDLTFLKIIVQIPPSPSQNAVQMPHMRIHSGDQMPLPRGHFTGTEGRKKRLQLLNKIFINTANNSHSI